MNWSGGKDSALAFYKAKQQGISVEALVTSVNSGTDRVSMHGVRRELLEKQAVSIGLPLHTIVLPEMPGMQAYENSVHKRHSELKQAGFSQAIFGDIFLEDLKRYREELLAKDQLECLFPIWKMESREVVKQFLSLGFKAIVICVNSSLLDQKFCGRLLDESFVEDLPPQVDPCGENGEYHSFVFDGPIFSEPVSFTKGDVVFKAYAAPKQDDCFTLPQPEMGFYFQDLLS
ncbi:MAG: diphthine--ammonia ligase [Chitinophagaceae bacterium]|nr:MAG: diphthine--ammonia ligase [Chitinophagaceae bacterium]